MNIPKGDVIYQPKANAGEYAPLATNPYVGCGHLCAYCYVPGAMHISRAEFNKPARLREGYMDRLRADAAKFGAAGLDDVHRQIFITFSSDPWHPGGDYVNTRIVLLNLIDHGLAFCTLTKSGTKGLCDADLFRPGHDAFAATLTSLDDRFSRKWEPDAALPAERIAGLRRFHERGIFTWVSIEPTLDVEASLELVRATYGFVDLYKIGRANYIPTITGGTDWRDYTLRMLDLVTNLGCSYYFKKDLQPHLPEGLFNPLRVPQHH